MQRDVTVREVMDDTYVGVSAGDDVLETADLLLSEGAAVAVVQEGSEVVGGLAPRDVMELIVDGTDPGAATVADAMTEAVRTIQPDRSLADARDRMTARATGWLVVTDGDGPAGVVTERDLLAGSTLHSEGTTEPGAAAGDAGAVPAAGAAAGEGETAAEDAFEDQGICEICGSLTHDLASFNGQLRCTDCRSV